KYFQNSRYVAVDLGVGDKTWDYHKLDAIADLLALPFPEFTFDGCINIVTLEHVREPGCALREIARVLKTGGVFLTVVPHEWEVHQSPHDYFRYTRHGLEYLLQKAGFTDIRIQPVGGYFRLLARRLLNGLQFFPVLLFPFAALLLVPPALLLPFASAALGADFSGTAAFNYAKAAAELGPRPPGSPANHRLQSYIEAQLRKTGCQIIEDSFRSQTPVGAVVMKNIIARFPGSSGRIIAITGHYDTKYMPKQRFVGANDGGSSTGFLLELARVLGAEKRTDEIDLVWFDGEEAYGEWSATDSVYGSRHLAEKWAKDGTLSRVKALINVDMIGDKDLGILYESNSSPDLLKLVWKSANDLGYGKYFLTQPSAT